MHDASYINVTRKGTLDVITHEVRIATQGNKVTCLVMEMMGI
jgi:hypothetical protein